MKATLFTVKPVVLALLLACGPAAASTASAPMVIDPNIRTEYETAALTRLAGDIRHPWALAFVGSDKWLVSAREEGLFIVENGITHAVSGGPAFYATNQGGMLDLVTHPNFAENGYIYLSYSKGDSDASTVALARARLEGQRLVDLETIFESNTYTEPGRHYGAKIAFLNDGTLLMSIGDRGAEPKRAQDTQDHSGSIVRLNDDGSTPEDNPFVGREGYAPEIYSYGHRNIQGIIQHPETGDIWVTEHGPRGGDELNRIEPGENYGWPIVTLGRDYGTEGPFPDAESRRHPDMTSPVFEFLPTLAPSGLAVLEGDQFGHWQGNLLAGGLSAERILRIVLEDREVIHIEELLLGEIGRIREVRQGPDGHVYILSDEEDGGLYRLSPAE
ncbi:PQQ-dependent sugar dehydrogenase [Marinimicrobium alkaliphilum]|uniref:PQQ-dependent sugar dehydrogenase n=1 Tax=Marinimicrobium alkaliphilum TaxID=2202654 RepID=UPI000DBA55F3|nr:PQQ-dependent sugar dehydrogenase [Marinimicrobium alkaliphilum]